MVFCTLSGHTHIGINIVDFIPSNGDIATLKVLKQKQSVIYISNGKFKKYEVE